MNDPRTEAAAEAIEGMSFQGHDLRVIIAEAALAAADAVDPVRQAAEELLALKDGPRDENYRQRKGPAWDALREALNSGGMA